MLAAPHQRLLGEIVLTLLHGQHRAALPILCFLELLARLVLEAFLVGDGGGDLLLRLHQLGPHVEDDLIEHLLGLLEFRDHRVDVGSEEHGDTIENVHMCLDGFSKMQRNGGDVW